MCLNDLNYETILLSSTPERIVCLVPSITELLVDLELENKIVGITKFCIKPNYLKNKCEIIGGTKKVNIKKIKDLKPDLIIANKEENNENDVNELKRFTKVLITEIKTIQDNISLIEFLGNLFTKKEIANKLISETLTIFKDLKKYQIKNKKVLYLIWKKPYMSVGIDTFIHEILNKIGFENVILQTRYPIIEIEEFIKVDYVFLSSEPYPFRKKDFIEIKNKLPHSKIIFVDGTYFSWYGSRVSKSRNYFETLISKLELNNELQFCSSKI